MKEFGIAEPALQRMIQVSYALVGLASFFTVGEDEVRAWTIGKGATAVEAPAPSTATWRVASSARTWWPTPTCWRPAAAWPRRGQTGQGAAGGQGLRGAGWGYPERAVRGVRDCPQRISGTDLAPGELKPLLDLWILQ